PLSRYGPSAGPTCGRLLHDLWVGGKRCARSCRREECVKRSTPSVTWQPLSRTPRSRAHGFASPPYDGFAFVEDEEVLVGFIQPPRSSWARARPSQASLAPLLREK